MRLARLTMSAAVVAATAFTGVTTPANAAGEVRFCTASVSISTNASGETNASVTASVNGDCPVGRRDEMSCQVILIGPLGVVKASSGYGVSTEGCYDSSVTMSNGIQGGAYTAVGIVSYGGYVPGVDATAAVA